MLPMFLAKVELETIVTCVTSQDKFNWAELFVDREASRFATAGRNSAARQFAFAWMSSWLHLEHAYQARRHKPAVNNYCEGRYGASPDRKEYPASDNWNDYDTSCISRATMAVLCSDLLTAVASAVSFLHYPACRVVPAHILPAIRC